MKVIGFGDNVVDRYMNKNLMFPGGNAVNFCVYAKQCGADAAYLGVFAEDREARLLQETLKSLGIDTSHCAVEAGSTTERYDVNLVDGDRVFVADEERETSHGPKILETADLEYLKQFSLIHSGCYAEEEDEIRKLKEVRALVTFDFSCEAEYREDEFLNKICPYIDMALFSAEEMDAEQVKALQQKVIGLGTPYILVTDGIKGQILYDGKNYYKGTVKLVEPVDTMGAGDSFFTSFAVTLLNKGWKKGEPLKEEMIKEAFEFAAEFSANNCLKEGAFGFGAPIE